MFLVRLIYASKISSDFGPEDIENILQSARTYNVKTNVTGMLVLAMITFYNVWKALEPL